MTDPELYQAAIAASGLSARRFCIDVLDVEERTGRYWLQDDRPLPGPVRIVCRAIVDRPTLAAELVKAHEAIVQGR